MFFSNYIHFTGDHPNGIENVISSFTAITLYRRSLLQYFRHRKNELVRDINAYFTHYIDNHDQQTRTAILRAFHIFLETAKEYEWRIPALIEGLQSFASCKEIVMIFVADLTDLSNELIDMIERGLQGFPR